MIDWNRYMSNALNKLAYDPKKQEKKFNEKLEKQKKKFLEESKKIEQTPSEKLQDELEPIAHYEE
tara:strand:+ start:436 stop:630 length:195 start_codon:yes stop_codon:yes gene_type:complete